MVNVMKYVAAVKTKAVLGFDLDGKTVWGEAEIPAYEYAKASLKKGDSVNVEYILVKGQMKIQKIEKIQVASKREETTPVTTKDAVAVKPETKVYHEPYVKPEVEKYGYKDIEYGRYFMNPKTPEESKQIRSLSLMDSTSNIVAGMMEACSGQVGPEDMLELVKKYINTVYDVLDNKTK